MSDSKSLGEPQVPAPLDQSHTARGRIIAHKGHAGLPGHWRAQKLRYNSFALEVELPCINGLSAWFSVATFHEADDEERLITDGARQEAGEYATKFAALAATDASGEKAGLTQAAEGSELLRLKSLNAELREGLSGFVRMANVSKTSKSNPNTTFVDTRDIEAFAARARSLLSRTT